MSLPDTNISIMMVRNQLDCPSTDLGTLVVKAKTGGRSGYAFSILENGGSGVDGSLLPGSLPYWNIWSNNSPGQWVLPRSGANAELTFELKRDTSNKYVFILDAFRGYNSDAKTPIPPSAGLLFHRVGTRPLETSISLRANLGEYDWRKISSVTKFKAVVYDGSSVFSNTSPIPITLGQPVNIGELPLTISMSSEYTKEYSVRIALCSSDGNEVGWLPVEGVISITVMNDPKPYIGIVYINGLRQIFRLDDVINDHFNGTYTGFGSISANWKALNKIVYDKINTETNAVIQTITVTSFSNNERPGRLAVYNVGDPETFWFDMSRLYNDNNTYIRVSYYYE